MSVSQPGNPSKYWSSIHQIVIRTRFQQDVLEPTYDDLWFGHLLAAKTYKHVLKHLFYSSMNTGVVNLFKACRTYTSYLLEIEPIGSSASSSCCC